MASFPREPERRKFLIMVDKENRSAFGTKTVCSKQRNVITTISKLKIM